MMQIYLLGSQTLREVRLVDAVGHACSWWFGGEKWESPDVSRSYLLGSLSGAQWPAM